MNNVELYNRVWNKLEAGDVKEYEEGLLKHFELFTLIAKHFEATTVLEVGCGTGISLIELQRQGFKVTGFDRTVKPSLANKNLVGVDLIEGDIQKAPFKDKQFDATACCGVIHHINEKKAMAEIKRITNKVAYVGMYGNKGLVFETVEKIARKILAKVPYKASEKICKLLGFSNFKTWITLDWIYVTKLKRYKEEDFMELFGEEWVCVFQRVRRWVNCIAFRKSLLSEGEQQE